MEANTLPKSISACDTEDNLTVVYSESEIAVVPWGKKAPEMFLMGASSRLLAHSLLSFSSRDLWALRLLK